MYGALYGVINDRTGINPRESIVEHARDYILAILKLRDAEELESRLMMSSSVFYYASLGGVLLAAWQIYTNFVFGAALYRVRRGRVVVAQ